MNLVYRMQSLTSLSDDSENRTRQARVVESARVYSVAGTPHRAQQSHHVRRVARIVADTQLAVLSQYYPN